MTTFPRLVARAWVLIPAGLWGIFVWMQWARVERVLALSALPEWSVDQPAHDPRSPTGYADGRRSLIVPGDNPDSHHWIAQTQDMLARGDWRVRRVDYDNAPLGRETRRVVLYRWWLALLAKIDQLATSVPPGLGVSRAALYADPLWFLLLGVAATLFTARQFGRFAASVVGSASATLYPLAGVVVPGAPGQHGMTLACALWSVLLLAAGVRKFISPAESDSPATAGPAVSGSIRRWFFAAGVLGGIGLWLDAKTQVILIAGLALGGGLHVVFARPPLVPVLPWRVWAGAGALTSALGYVVEYFPSHLSWRLDGNHPLWGVVWLGLGEMLVIASAWRGGVAPAGSRGDLVRATLACVALLTAPVGIFATRQGGLMTRDMAASQLTTLDDGVRANHLAAWFGDAGFAPEVLATCLPVLLVGAAAFWSLRRTSATGSRGAIFLVLGPAIVALVMAGFRLRWWSVFDATAVALLAVLPYAAPGATGSGLRWLAGLGVALLAALGIGVMFPQHATLAEGEFTAVELRHIIERDFSHWLAQRSQDAVVFAPPALTTALHFYGGLRGLGTFDADNREGFVGAVRIAGALSTQEALTLIQNRQITHLALPSWERGLDRAARDGVPAGKSTFIEQLHEWIVPRWLRPIPYFAPKLEGLDSTAIVVFEVVEDQDDAALVSEMTTYFLETGLLGHASDLRQFVRRFPTDLGALVSLAEIEKARGHETAFASAFAAVLAALSSEADRYLEWDRRIRLAIVLAQGGRADLARAQIDRCLKRVGEEDLRSLTTGTLLRFLILCKNLAREIPDPRLRDLAVALLPPASRSQVR